MRTRSDARATVAAGMTLVELMVGLAVGLIVSLAILRVAAGFEGYKRSVVSGSDAQINGAVAVLQIQRDLQMAGYGVAMAPAALGCTVAGRRAGRPIVPFVIAPVAIRAGDGRAPDALELLSSGRTGAATPMLVTRDHPVGSVSFAVRSSVGVAAGDLLLAVPPQWTADTGCTLFAATNDAGSAPATLSAGNVPHGPQDPWNDGIDAVWPAGGYVAGSVLLNAGTLVRRRYAIGAGDALVASTLGPDGEVQGATAAFAQIVMLRALYGKDVDGDGMVDAYDRETPASAAGWSRVVAVRFAIVARSVQREKEIVSPDALDWDVGRAVPVAGAASCGAESQCLDLRPPAADGDGGEWRHYRYKLFDATAPLRNVLWNS